MERAWSRGVSPTTQTLQKNEMLKERESAGVVQSQERPKSGLGWGFSAMKLQLGSN